jgi:hypothetical protein
MDVRMIFLPVFAMVALTFGLMFWMASQRTACIKRGEVKMKDMALGQPAWPARVMQIGNAYHNQLQLPLLFYVLVLMAYITRFADLLFVLMSWVFVVLRYYHAYVHVTSNRVPHRFTVFAASAVVLLAMWVIYALRLLAGL